MNSATRSITKFFSIAFKKTRVRYSVVYFPVRKKKRDRGKKKIYNKLETENSDNVYIYLTWHH